MRWTWKKQRVMDPKGNVITIDATVIAAQEIPIGSRMWLGSLLDWEGLGTGPGSTGIPDDLCEVKTYGWTPDLKGRNVRREYGLLRFRDSPT